MSSRRPKGEGSIFPRPDGRWVGRLTYEDPVTGLRKQSQVSATSKQGTSEKLRELEDRVRAGAPPRDDKAPLGAFAEQWIATTLAVSDRRQSTKSLYASLTRSHLAGSHLGNLPMNRVTPTAVERWLTELRKRGLAESTVRTTYTVARAVGDAAVRDGLIGRNPFAAIKRPKVEQEAAHLTIEQFHALQGRSPSPGTRPWSRCSDTPGYGAVRRWPSTGETSTWTSGWSGSAEPWPGSTAT